MLTQFFARSKATKQSSENEFEKTGLPQQQAVSQRRGDGEFNSPAF